MHSHLMIVQIYMLSNQSLSSLGSNKQPQQMTMTSLGKQVETNHISKKNYRF
jgi:hypothetical protein